MLGVGKSAVARDGSEGLVGFRHELVRAQEPQFALVGGDAAAALFGEVAFTGSRIFGESQQASGRPDAILETDKAVYVFEFKFGQTAAAALDQCREKNYAAPYAADPRPVWYVAINYSAATRTLDDPLCEQAKETRSPQN